MTDGRFRAWLRRTLFLGVELRPGEALGVVAMAAMVAAMVESTAATSATLTDMSVALRMPSFSIAAAYQRSENSVHFTTERLSLKENVMRTAIGR